MVKVRKHDMVLHKETGLRELALFAGAGGGILGGLLLGWRTVCAVEIEEYPRAVLLQRQLDGILPQFPIWDDVRTFDGKPWKGKVDVISGGFPCQPFSLAGKQKRERDERNMWPETARIIREIGPGKVLLENVPGLTAAQKIIIVIVQKMGQLDFFSNNSPKQGTRFIRRIIKTIEGRSYFGRILRDLAQMGYDAKWGVLGAVHAGAPHRRHRIWIVANTSGGRCHKQKKREDKQSRRGKAVSPGVANGRENVPNTDCELLDTGRKSTKWNHGANIDSCSAGKTLADTACFYAQGCNYEQGEIQSGGGDWWSTEPRLDRVAYGVADRVDRLKAVGNGQVPAVAALAWKMLTE